jgi:hypothetical protein
LNPSAHGWGDSRGFRETPARFHATTRKAGEG